MARLFDHISIGRCFKNVGPMAKVFPGVYRKLSRTVAVDAADPGGDPFQLEIRRGDAVRVEPIACPRPRLLNGPRRRR